MGVTVLEHLRKSGSVVHLIGYVVVVGMSLCVLNFNIAAFSSVMTWSGTFVIRLRRALRIAPDGMCPTWGSALATMASLVFCACVVLDMSSMIVQAISSPPARCPTPEEWWTCRRARAFRRDNSVCLRTQGLYEAMLHEATSCPELVYNLKYGTRRYTSTELGSIPLLEMAYDHVLEAVQSNITIGIEDLPRLCSAHNVWDPRCSDPRMQPRRLPVPVVLVITVTLGAIYVACVAFHMHCIKRIYWWRSKDTKVRTRVEFATLLGVPLLFMPVYQLIQAAGPWTLVAMQGVSLLIIVWMLYEIKYCISISLELYQNWAKRFTRENYGGCMNARAQYMVFLDPPSVSITPVLKQNLRETFECSEDLIEFIDYAMLSIPNVSSPSPWPTEAEFASVFNQWWSQGKRKRQLRRNVAALVGRWRTLWTKFACLCFGKRGHRIQLTHTKCREHLLQRLPTDLGGSVLEYLPIAEVILLMRTTTTIKRFARAALLRPRGNVAMKRSPSVSHVLGLLAACPRITSFKNTFHKDAFYPIQVSLLAICIKSHIGLQRLNCIHLSVISIHQLVELQILLVQPRTMLPSLKEIHLHAPYIYSTQELVDFLESFAYVEKISLYLKVYFDDPDETVVLGELSRMQGLDTLHLEYDTDDIYGRNYHGALMKLLELAGSLAPTTYLTARSAEDGIEAFEISSRHCAVGDLHIKLSEWCEKEVDFDRILLTRPCGRSWTKKSRYYAVSNALL